MLKTSMDCAYCEHVDVLDDMVGEKNRYNDFELGARLKAVPEI